MIFVLLSSGCTSIDADSIFIKRVASIEDLNSKYTIKFSIGNGLDNELKINSIELEYDKKQFSCQSIRVPINILSSDTKTATTDCVLKSGYVGGSFNIKGKMDYVILADVISDEKTLDLPVVRIDIVK